MKFFRLCSPLSITSFRFAFAFVANSKWASPRSCARCGPPSRALLVAQLRFATLLDLSPAFRRAMTLLRIQT